MKPLSPCFFLLSFCPSIPPPSRNHPCRAECRSHHSTRRDAGNRNTIGKAKSTCNPCKRNQRKRKKQKERGKKKRKKPASTPVRYRTRVQYRLNKWGLSYGTFRCQVECGKLRQSSALNYARAVPILVLRLDCHRTSPPRLRGSSPSLSSYSRSVGRSVAGAFYKVRAFVPGRNYPSTRNALRFAKTPGRVCIPV